MIAPPVAIAAPAPTEAPTTLEAAFALAHVSARRVSDPASILLSHAPVEDKLAALDVLHSRVPWESHRDQVAALKALIRATSSPDQPPTVRARALMFLGYAMPRVNDDEARGQGLNALLEALKDPSYRIFALRGLGPASHGLPKVYEGRLQQALLDLLDSSMAGEERTTALVALFSFVYTRDDLSRRKPGLVEQLDQRLLGPIEKDPVRFFVSDPRFLPNARQMAIATIWSSARHRQVLGQPEPARRVHALLVRLASVETDKTVLSWITYYRDAKPARQRRHPRPQDD